MGTLIKFFVGFWVVWIIWYLSGGPMRDDISKPYVKINETGQLETVEKSIPK